MKILQVIPVFSGPFGGPVTVVSSISKELAKKHEVEVYTTTALDFKHDFKPKIDSIDGYNVIYFSRTLKQLSYSYLFGQLNFSLNMVKALKENISKFDIVHVHSWHQFPEVAVSYYAKKYQVPYLLQVHGSLTRVVEKQKLKEIYDTLFGYKVLKNVTKVIAINQEEVKDYEAMRVPKEKIEIVPNGLDFSDYTNLPPRGSFRKKVGIKDDEKLLLYLGRIHKIKGIDILVKSFGDIVKKYADVKLVIIGPDDGFLGELKNLIKTLKLDKYILILGPLYGKDKIEAYVDSDVCVFPTRYEVFGMTIIEASACAKPVISTTASCVALEIISNGKTGFLIKPDSVPDLTQALENLLQNESESKKMGNLLRERAIKLFSIKNVTIQLENTYANILCKNVTFNKPSKN